MGELVHFPIRKGWEPEYPKIAAARELGVTERTLERWVALDCPHSRTEAGHLRFVPSRVREWRDQQTDRSGDDAA